MRRARNQEIVFEWKEHSSYLTPSEAKQKGIRIELFTGRPTKIVQDKTTHRWWILMGCNPHATTINKTLEV